VWKVHSVPEYTELPNASFANCKFRMLLAKIKDTPDHKYPVRSLTKLNASVTCRLPAGTTWLTAKRYKFFPIRVEYRSIKAIKWTHLPYSSSCQEPASNSCVQPYQWTYRTSVSISTLHINVPVDCTRCRNTRISSTHDLFPGVYLFIT
jgi:hypothetical protein